MAPATPSTPEISRAPATSVSVSPEPPASPITPPRATTLEPPYATGRFPWPDDPKARKAALKELEIWNTGGLGEGQAWHPAPRVVIGEPVLRKGKANTRELMRALRAEHYWTVRRCYDPALRGAPKLDGRAVLELSLDKAGRVLSAATSRARVPDTRQHKTSMTDEEVVRCWLRGLKGAELPRPRGKATVAFSIDVWPGDAPLREVPASMPGSLPLDEVERLVTARLPELDACVAEARAELPGAWGRLPLRVDVDEQGAPHEIAETESTFPAPSMVACATRVLRTLTWPKARGGTARVTVPLRVAPPR